MYNASGPGDQAPLDPPSHPSAPTDAWTSCPALKAEIDKLTEVRAQLRNKVAALTDENLTLEAGIAQERVRAAMSAREVADLQPTLDALSSECKSLTCELELLQQMQTEARKSTGGVTGRKDNRM